MASISRSYRSLILFALSVLAAVISRAQPVITSLSPSATEAGTTVTINGTGFNPTPAGNTIWLGSVKTPATAASATSLSFTVPTGFRSGGLSVTNSGLTAYSPGHLDVTFPGGNSVFTAGSFYPYTSITTSSPYSITAADMNNDSKPELLTANYLASTVSVFLNASSGTTTNFSSHTDYAVGGRAGDIVTADLDGDGLQDIVTGNIGPGYSVSVLRNTYSGGGFSFDAAINLAAAAAPYYVNTGDIDGDGKPDILAINGYYISVYRNTSTVGNISFQPALTFLAGQYASGIGIADLNGDGKPEVVTGLNTLSPEIIVLRNTSVPGTISFAAGVSYPAGYAGLDVCTGDMDGDGKTDLVIASIGSSKVTVLRNTTSGSTITLDAPLQLNSSSSLWDIDLADLNGDGKLDIVCAIKDVTKTISVFRNLSAGSLSFDTRVDYLTNNANARLVAADLRNIGRLDLAIVSTTGNAIYIMRNKISEPPVVSSFTPTSGGPGTVVTISGSNLAGITGASFGGVPGFNLNVLSDNTATIQVGAGTSGSVAVTAPYGTGSLAGFVFTPPPSITGISPKSGTPGQVITISGTAFSPVATDNTVYFGGAKATVISATATALLVTVPSNAMYAPVSVTRNNLTSYSKDPFNIVFPDGIIDNNTFRKSWEYPLGSNIGLRGMTMADIDRDGRTDLVVNNYVLNSISIYPNTTVNGIVSFGAPVSFATLSTHPVEVTAADFDGDGKLDIVTPCEWSSTVAVFRNNSTPGNFSLSVPQILNAGSYTEHIAVHDLDGDGRPDMTVSNNSSQYVSVFRNLSSGASISFAPQQTFAVPGFYTHSTALGDIDGDGKPDMVSACASDSICAVYRNTSVAGIISFAARMDIFTGHPVSYVTMADIDSNGKKEIILSSGSYGNTPYFDSSILVYGNNSTPGNIALGTPLLLNGGLAWEVAVNDFDGDGKPDLAASTYNGAAPYKVALYKNTSTPGAISFGPGTWNVNDPLSFPQGIDCGDLDGDSNPDIALIYTNTESVTVYINQNGTLREFCPGGTYSLYSNITGATYQWQVMRANESSYNNVAADAWHSGVNSSQMTITAIPSSWYGSKYRCVVNTGTSKVFTIKFINRWTGAMDNNWENPGNWSCGTVPDQNTDVVIGSGTVVVNANTTIHSLYLSPGVNFTVTTGVVLTILH